MRGKEKNNTPGAESAEIKSPREIVSETVKCCLDDLKVGKTMTAADLFAQLKEDNIELQKENIRLKDEISIWKPLACSALGALCGVLGAAIGLVVMKKIGIL